MDANRPVSVHGAACANSALYANAASLINTSSKMNGGLNLTASAPAVATNRVSLNHSMNANLNLSALNTSANNNGGSDNNSPAGGSNQTRTTSVLDTTSSRDHSHHSLNTTQLSPIGGRSQQQRHQQQQQQHHQRHNQYNNVNILRSHGELAQQQHEISNPFNSTTYGRHNLSNGGVNITAGGGDGNSSRNNTLSRDNNKEKSRLNGSVLVPANVSRFIVKSKEAGVKEMIVSLGLLCLVSLLLALLSLMFLLKLSPRDENDYLERNRNLNGGASGKLEVHMVFRVTRAMCALALSLNLCCLLVCAIQFLFAVKLVKAAHGRAR